MRISSKLYIAFIKVQKIGLNSDGNSSLETTEFTLLYCIAVNFSLQYCRIEGLSS
jgi:hypothetical protein